MRIVSQDGMVDVPYELIGLSISSMEVINDYRVMCDSRAIDDNSWIMARYTSKAKAIKAMKMVREAYMGLPVVFQNANIDDSVLESFKNHNVVLLKSYDEPQSKVEYVNSGIFQFPKDDEIEV